MSKICRKFFWQFIFHKIYFYQNLSKNFFEEKVHKFDWENKFKPHAFQRELRPDAPDDFGLNPPSQLVIGYHWLVILK